MIDRTPFSARSRSRTRPRARSGARSGAFPLLLAGALAAPLVFTGAPSLLKGAAPASVAWADTLDPGQELPEGVTAEMLELGREIYDGVGTCLTCHGAEGVGTPIGPALADNEWIHIDGSYPEIVALVRSGVPEPKQFPMPMLPRAGLELTDEQVAAVAAYVWLISRDP